MEEASERCVSGGGKSGEECVQVTASQMSLELTTHLF